jgi:D-3-phosphoglycerate dehydrogenase
VGSVGRILGEAGVNIGGMQVSRDGVEALTVLTVDTAIAPDQLAAIVSDIAASSGKAVDFA